MPAAGMTVAEILDDLPYLTQEDIQACFAFAAEREREHDDLVLAVALAASAAETMRFEPKRGRWL
jgi:hypothetical protein